MTTSASSRLVSSALLLGLGIAACTPGGGDDDPPLEPWPDPGTSEQFLGNDVMPELDLLISDDGMAALAAEPREYVEATMVYQGVEYGPVGVRLKGVNSFLPIGEKPSLRVNVNEYIPDATFFGLKDLTFNNMKSDWSMMHERLAYWVAREAGMPAPRANYALITINGQPYGLYTNVETVKKRMITGNFEDDEGSLFEATDVDFAPQYIPNFELEYGDDDRTRLSGLADALTNPDPAAAIAAAASFVDLGHFQRYWAVSSVIGQFDAFPYSLPGDDYFLYDDPTSGKLWFIHWGMDETFFAADYSPMQTQSILAERCKASPACFQGYVDQTWEVLALTEAMGLEAEKARIQAEIAPLVAADTRKPYTAAQVSDGQMQLYYFIHGRREILTNTFPPSSR